MVSPVVSVVIPAKNAAEHVREALQSILTQDIQDLEVILIDDGSTDQTAAIVAGFVDSRIRVAQGGGQGVSAARNLGASLAHSSIIAFMDADDRSRHDRLGKQLHMLHSLDLDAIGSSYEAIDEQGRSLGVHPHLTAVCDIRLASYAFNPIVGASLLLRKNAWDSIGGFRSDVSLGEDYDLVTRFLTSGFRVGAHPEALYSYRWHESSTSARRREELHAAMRDIRATYWCSSPPSPELAWNLLSHPRNELTADTIRLRVSAAAQVVLSLARQRRPRLAALLLASLCVRHPLSLGRQAVSLAASRLRFSARSC